MLSIIYNRVIDGTRMSKSGKYNRAERHLGHFAEQVKILSDELESAIRWQRPSILLAVYESKHICTNARTALKNSLADIGQSVYNFRVNEKRFDVPLALSQHPDRENTVFFITGLRSGGGKGGHNAYRALNLRREYLVDYQIRAVFWLTISESIDLPRCAPDFWAFRHRVIEFIDSPV